MGNRAIGHRVILAAVPLVFAGAAFAQARPMGGMTMDSADHNAAMAAEEAMGGALMEASHMRMTPARPASVADSARAAARVGELRQALQKYRDVHAAEADGYRIFLPGVPQQVYHFTNTRYGIAAAFGFDPSKPTSLLYKKNADGGFELVGAMYTASARATMDELDRRVPLSIAHWHQHVNWCVPPRGAGQRWAEKEGELPRFGPRSPIVTREACEAVGGQFLPRIFGWMVHANVFASDDPRVIWGVGEDHEH